MRGPRGLNRSLRSSGHRCDGQAEAKSKRARDAAAAAIIATGGVILIGIGVLVYTNELFQLNIEAQKLLDRLGLNFFNGV